MGQEIALENGRISDVPGLVTLTTNRVILHTIMHNLSTYTYIPNFIEIEDTFFGRLLTANFSHVTQKLGQKSKFRQVNF